MQDSSPAFAPELESQFEQHRSELTAYCLPDARVAVRGRGRRAGDVHPRLARLRPLRGPGGGHVVALPDRDERVPRHARTAGSAAPRPMDLGPAREPIVENLNTLPEVTWIQPIPGSGRRRRRPRDDPARVRRGAAASAAAPARGAHPLRGAALAGDRGRRAAGDERRLGEQRAAARARDARLRASRRPATRRARRGRPRAARPLRRGVRAVRHRSAHVADPGGRDRSRCRRSTCGSRAATTSSPGGSGPGIGCKGSRVDPDRLGERLAGVRPVQAERRTAATSRGRCRCSSSQAGGSSSSRSSSTPRRCSRSSGCRRASTRSTSREPDERDAAR